MRLKDLASGLPTEAIWKSGTMTKCKYALENMSNSLRLILLYRYLNRKTDVTAISDDNS